ncbi:MDR family MFS transporter [Virgibacillus chiguensis]|uniref:MFS transporter, DHA1 family, multidrug resistance protein B n=1 Tax=Virgibacillus chiguensis TaxID=411959 RepID=A0A1M5X9R6_9BACI|nr:MFS transporter [Virgibacillus chiguensis]SHH96402.1 MFS transporter, DHA1 family, multidrug resistance protein B [Virgibacillus chiguensis]
MNLSDFKQFHLNIKIRMVVSFVSDIAEMSIFPFMAIYFSSNLGIAWAGAILTLTTVVSIIFGMYGGSFADRFGRKKVMVAGSMIQTISFVIIALANSPWFESVWLTFFMFFLLSITSRFIDPASEALLIDVSSEEEQPLMYRFVYWSSNLAFSIGIILGGLFFQTHKFELFLGFAILSIFTFLLTVGWIQDDYVPKNDKKNGVILGFISDYIKVLKDVRFMVLCVSTLLILSLEFQLYGFIAVRLNEDIHTSIFGLIIDGPKMLSILIVTNTMIVILASGIVGNIAQKINMNTTLFVGLFMYVLGYSFLAWNNVIVLLTVAIAVATVGEILFQPIRSTYVAQLANKDARGSYIAVSGLSMDAGQILGSLGLMVSALLSNAMMTVLFLLIGGLGIMGFLWTVQDYRLKTKKDIA